MDLCPDPLPLSEWLEQALFETLHKVWPILSPQESSSLHTVQPKHTPWVQFPFCSLAKHKQLIINKNGIKRELEVSGSHQYMVMIAIVVVC